MVLTAIPVTLALTLFVFYLYGYTLNCASRSSRSSSIGILVDDAIVVVENIVRHMRTRGHDTEVAAVAIRAVDEVGNPIHSRDTGGRGSHPSHGLRRRVDGPTCAPFRSARRPPCCSRWLSPSS